jgi:hypothetical protein
MALDILGKVSLKYSATNLKRNPLKQEVKEDRILNMERFGVEVYSRRSVLK